MDNAETWDEDFGKKLIDILSAEAETPHQQKQQYTITTHARHNGDKMPIKGLEPAVQDRST